MTRMRLVGWRVQPIVMADDGDQLTPVPVNPVDIPATAWADWINSGHINAVEQLRSQIEEETPA